MINPIYFFLWWVMWLEGYDAITDEGYGYEDGYDDN